MGARKGNIPWNKKPKIKVKCSHCDEELNRILYYIKRNKHHFCNIHCHARWKKDFHIPWNKGKKDCFSRETRRKISIGNKGKILSENTRKKMSNIVKERYKNPKKHPMYNKKHREESKRKISESGKILWQNLEHIKKVLKSRHIKPNNPETQLISILKQVAPDFRYNGDFSQGISIGRRIPDFVNCDGKKQIIELFGAYFHSPILNKTVDWKRTYQGTMEHYRKYGFKCLIIWDYELKNPKKVVEKIKAFN